MARPKKEEFNQIRYQNEFNKRNYDKIEITVQKGRKAVIQEAAKAAGQSTNKYINQAITEKMERDGIKTVIEEKHKITKELARAAKYYLLVEEAALNKSGFIEANKAFVEKLEEYQKAEGLTEKEAEDNVFEAVEILKENRKKEEKK